MPTSRPPRSGSSLPVALPALLRATHFFGLALGSALGKLRDSGVTTAGARQFAERVGGQWELRRALARGEQSHALGLLLSPGP
jgi:hypothetical protein